VTPREATILAAMAATTLDPAIQLDQTRYRLAIADGWALRPGTAVLEVGCGQGDMTAVLAEAVGEHGRVVAVDNAAPSYGAPLTIGESTDALRASALGTRVDIRLGFDVLGERDRFPADAFDYVVLAHSSWYFASVDELRATLRAVRAWAPVLCFAEWDLRLDAPEQLAHLLAVLAQGQVVTDGNVRVPFSRETLLRIFHETGWRVDRQRPVDTAGLRDADWEIDAALRLEPPAGGESLAARLELLESVARGSGNRPLPAYQLLASRA
jgi:SAM-dependent methyltransferase